MNQKNKALLIICFVVILVGWGCRLVTPPAAKSPTAQATLALQPSETAPATELPANQAPSPSPSQAITPSQTPTQAAPILAPLNGGLTISAIHMFSADSGWGIGSAGGASDRILKTADGGNSWREVTPPEPALAGSQPLTALGYFQDLETAWVIYYNHAAPGLPSQAVVWRTQDGGQSWQASQSLDLSGLVETFAPSHLQFIDAQTGWLLVHIGVGMNHDYVALYKTGDGGSTWSRLLDPDNEVQGCYKTSMLFTSTQEGWLTGTCNGVAAGVWLYRTGDGGTTWQVVQLPAPQSRPDLFTNFENGCGSDHPTFLDAQTGYIAVACERLGTDPRVTDYFLYSTRDGGKSWTPASYPGGALTFFDGQSGLALGKEIYTTQDGGKSWKKISTVTWDGSFDFADAKTGWAVARAGDQIALVRSDNGGQSWALLKPKIIP